jgi:hypothetical protein
MARFKDFGLGGQQADLEPVTFAMHGEEFECVRQVQGAVLLDIIKRAASNEAADSAALTLDFFKKVMLDESYSRFESLINDKEKIITVEALGEVVAWLIGEYSDRPNQEPEV